MQKIVNYINKSVFVLLCTFICFGVSAKEINFDNIKGSSKPYNIVGNGKKHTLLPVDCNNILHGKYPDLCELFFQFHVFFAAWPDIRTPSRDAFIILADDIAMLRSNILHMCEEVVFYVDRKSGEILRFETKGMATYECNKQELLEFERLRKQDSSDDELHCWHKYDHLGPSNMIRIEDGGDIIWEYGGARFSVVNKMSN